MSFGDFLSASLRLPSTGPLSVHGLGFRVWFLNAFCKSSRLRLLSFGFSVQVSLGSCVFDLGCVRFSDLGLGGTGCQCLGFTVLGFPSCYRYWRGS